MYKRLCLTTMQQHMGMSHTVNKTAKNDDGSLMPKIFFSTYHTIKYLSGQKWFCRGCEMWCGIWRINTNNTAHSSLMDLHEDGEYCILMWFIICTLYWILLKQRYSCTHTYHEGIWLSGRTATCIPNLNSRCRWSALHSSCTINWKAAPAQSTEEVAGWSPQLVLCRDKFHTLPLWDGQPVA